MGLHLRIVFCSCTNRPSVSTFSAQSSISSHRSPCNSAFLSFLAILEQCCAMILQSFSSIDGSNLSTDVECRRRLVEFSRSIRGRINSFDFSTLSSCRNRSCLGARSRRCSRSCWMQKRWPQPRQVACPRFISYFAQVRSVVDTAISFSR